MKTGGLTGRLVAAGRALTGIGQNELASASGIPLEKLRLLEASAAAWIPDEESQALDRALEKYGAVIVPEGDGLGAGVRLKFTRQDTRQIGRLETEGGSRARTTCLECQIVFRLCSNPHFFVCRRLILEIGHERPYHISATSSA